MGCLKLHIDTESTLSVAYRKKGQKVSKITGSYYPFGLKHKGYNNVTSSNGNSTAQKFKYNGKEFEESLGINWYEMDMRQYDPTIARWTAVDPVTHYSMSTYTAFDNNPIYFADPSGADSRTIQDLEGNYWTVDCNENGACKNPKKEKRKEGESKDFAVWHGNTGHKTTKFYHSGSTGNKAGWYSSEDYLKIVEPIAIAWAKSLGGWHANWQGTMSLGSNYDFELVSNFLKDKVLADGFLDFLLNYGESLKKINNRRLRLRASGRVEPMGFDSPFFLGAGLLRKFIVRAASVKLSGAVNLKPKGFGSTGRNQALDILEQLTMKEAMSNPKMGRIIIRSIKDKRWVGWHKMQYTRTVGYGENQRRITVHYVAKFEEGVIKAVDDFKFKEN